jgi:mannose-6-phosphate isomerase-like protein (cupin superfamily)
MAIPVTKPPREDVLRCVARFKDLHRSDTCLPDCFVDGYRRTLMNVMGFQPPEADGDGGRPYSPVGDQNKPYLSHVRAGFGIGFVEATPGNGVMMHAHDTNETFLVIDGRWRVTWDGDKGEDSVELGPLDIVAVPTNIYRQFHCLEAPSGKEKATMMAIIGGDSPSAEFSPECEAILVEKGLLPAREKAS